MKKAAIILLMLVCGCSQVPGSDEEDEGAYCYLYAATWVYCSGDIECARTEGDELVLSGTWDGAGYVTDVLNFLQYDGDACGLVWITLPPHNHTLILINGAAIETSYGSYAAIAFDASEDGLVTCGPYRGQRVLGAWTCN